MAPGVVVGDRRAVRHAQTKAEILDAAWELARQRGLAGVSLGELALRVGMRAPSLYSYFRSKNEIYDAMFAQANRQFVDFIGQRLAGSIASPRERLRRGFRAYFEFCTADPVRYQLMFQRTVPGFEPAPESYAIAIEALRLFRDDLAETGVAIDQSDQDLLTALAAGLVDQQIANDPGGKRWARLVDDVVDMAYDHLIKKQRRQRQTRPSRGGTRR